MIDTAELRRLAEAAFADDYEKPWKSEYDNDVGPGDGGFWEFYRLASAKISRTEHAEIMEAACNSIIPLLDELERKTKALEEAIEIIKIWHGPNAWDIYYRASPEMKRIRSALEAK